MTGSQDNSIYPQRIFAIQIEKVLDQQRITIYTNSMLADLDLWHISYRDNLYSERLPAGRPRGRSSCPGIFLTLLLATRSTQIL
jgi:hypothetical protein